MTPGMLSRQPRDTHVNSPLVGKSEANISLLQIFAWWAPPSFHCSFTEHHQETLILILTKIISFFFFFGRLHLRWKCFAPIQKTSYFLSEDDKNPTMDRWKSRCAHTHTQPVHLCFFFLLFFFFSFFSWQGLLLLCCHQYELGAFTAMQSCCWLSVSGGGGHYISSPFVYLSPSPQDTNKPCCFCWMRIAPAMWKKKTKNFHFYRMYQFCGVV